MMYEEENGWALEADKYSPAVNFPSKWKSAAVSAIHDIFLCFNR